MKDQGIYMFYVWTLGRLRRMSHDICAPGGVFWCVEVSVKYTIIVCRGQGKSDLVFKGISDFLVEPNRIKIRVDDWREHASFWRTIEDADGLILHKESE